MNKLLVLLIAFSLLLGVFGFVGVMAVDEGVEATISEDVRIRITPEPVMFGIVRPETIGNPALNGPIMFDPRGSNVDVKVTVDSVSGDSLFAGGLKLDGSVPVGQMWIIPCVVIGDVCTYTPATTIPTLDVLVGTPAGMKIGTITYTVTGPLPP